jgi:hypothetical protein
MPLTVSHAAIAWPISRASRRLPAAALVIGSLSPDFEYLLRGTPLSTVSHTLAGVFAFCVPVSLAAWLFYRGLVHPAALQLLPAGMRHEPTRADRRLTWSALAWATLATLVGAITHLVWDAFTHEGGLAVAAIPALRSSGFSASALNLRWYQLFQHGSTLLGLTVLALWARQTWKGHSPEARRFAPGEAALLGQVLLTIAAVSAVAAVLNGMRAWHQGSLKVLAFAAVGGMDGTVLGLLGLAAASRLGFMHKGRIMPHG